MCWGFVSVTSHPPRHARPVGVLLLAILFFGGFSDPRDHTLFFVILVSSFLFSPTKPTFVFFCLSSRTPIFLVGFFFVCVAFGRCSLYLFPTGLSFFSFWVGAWLYCFVDCMWFGVLFARMFIKLLLIIFRVDCSCFIVWLFVLCSAV